jgi:phenylacetate-CoA ligase
MRRLLTGWSSAAKKDALLDPIIRYNPVYYRAARTAARLGRTAGCEERAALSGRLIERALRWARRSRYGRGRPPSLEHWPLLDKQALRQRPDDFRTPSRLSVPASTGGSTGVPLRLWRSLRCVAAEQAFLDDLLSSVGLDFRGSRVAVLRADTIKDPSDRAPPFGTYSHGGRRLLLSAHHLGPATCRWYADELERFRPDFLWVYPTAADALAAALQGVGRTVAVPAVLCSSEVLTSSARQRIASVFQAEVIDHYGLAERVGLAFSVRPEEYWFVPTYGCVELVPVANGAATDVRSAEIVATGFWNDAMPLVRYRTGDRVLYPVDHGEAELAEVALGLRPFLGIAGREQEYVLTPRGEKVLGINHLPRDVSNVVQIQLVQESPSFVRLRVVPEPGFGDRDREQLLRNARLKLASDIDIAVDLVEAVERLPSGKAPFVIHRMSSPA